MSVVSKPVGAPLPLLSDADAPDCGCDLDPRVEALVRELIGRVADKWTMIILEVLTEHGELRFTRPGRLVEGVSQKMLTQTLRQMERDGLVVRRDSSRRSAQGRVQADRPRREPRGGRSAASGSGRRKTFNASRTLGGALTPKRPRLPPSLRSHRREAIAPAQRAWP